MRFFRRRSRTKLHLIGEAEAYARSYGDRSDDILAVERLPPPPPPEPTKPRRLTGEGLRQAFEARLMLRSGRGG